MSAGNELICAFLYKVEGRYRYDRMHIENIRMKFQPFYKISSGASGNSTQKVKAEAKSNVTYNQFMRMDINERYELMDRIVNDGNIKVPDNLDDSMASKLIYALGMKNKPKVVSDTELDGMHGVELYRTVFDSKNLSAKEILEQVKNGEYTQLSGANSSAYGRAIYFADRYMGAISYARGQSSLVTRAKLNSNANIVSEVELKTMMLKDKNFSKKYSFYSKESPALFALSHGIDGWHDEDSGYRMIVNRGALTFSSTNKRVYDKNGNRHIGWRLNPEIE